MIKDIQPMTRLPNERSENVEEALVEIYECREQNLITPKEVGEILDKKVKPNVLEDLKNLKLLTLEGDRIHLSTEAESLASRVIRQKRLAERLLKDVLNLSDEQVDPAACQWEHILSNDVTNSICTLLGHPTHSPKDLPIPPGDCCEKESLHITPVICSLDRLPRGGRAKISYLAFKKNPDLYRVLSMGLVPGTFLEVIERIPTFIVQVHESQVAFDETIAQSVFVHPLQDRKQD